MSLLATWTLGLMVALEPSSPWRSTFEHTADAIARVASAEPLFEGDVTKTAALLVAVAWHESRLRPDARSKDGQYLCLYQVDKRHVATPSRLLADPELCTVAALKILRLSLSQCARRPENDRLAFFMSGACDKGLPQSRYRMFLAKRLLREHPVAARGG